MGLFSGISKALFGDPAKKIAGAEKINQEFLQKGQDFQRQSDAPLLAARNQGIEGLQGFFGGGQGQQQFIDDTRASPFFDQLIKSGQEGVLDNAQSMGLSRSGNTASDLNRSNQSVLQNLVNQRLSGFDRLSQFRPNTEAITGLFGQMGGNALDSRISQANLEQQQIGQLLNLIKSGATAGAGGA